MKDVCFKYNMNKCTGCHRQHLCSRCGGHHQALTCIMWRTPRRATPTAIPKSNMEKNTAEARFRTHT
eukprot:16430004-Heterocapsa_arctica.AAC.1